MESKMPVKRVRNIAIAAGFTFVLSIALSILYGHTVDWLLSCLYIDILFLTIFVYTLESSREQHLIRYDISNQYKEIAAFYCISCMLILEFSFFPEFVKPVMILSFFMTLLSSPELGICTGIFLNTLLCMAVSNSSYEYISGCILVLFGAQLARSMRKKKFQILGCLILFSLQLMVPCIFYYLSNQKFTAGIVIYNAFAGIAMLAVILLVVNRIYHKTEHAQEESVERIVQEDYPLVCDIRNYSKGEYIHAVKVSRIARRCTREISGRELVAAAAGFYYRLGVLEGDPFVQNGVRLATDNCFPEEVVEILSEYNGEEHLPSSRESAIIHMVDACVKKIEVLDRENLKSSWNQDMVIYQTLNEISASGIYDESGLSMNQFLKVREILVREEELL